MTKVHFKFDLKEIRIINEIMFGPCVLKWPLIVMKNAKS